MAELTGTTNGETPPVNDNNGNTGANGEWITKTLPQEFLTQTGAYEKLKVFKGPEDLVRSYFSLNDKMSSTGRLPKSDAPAEEWDTFYKAWGRPDKPEAYTLSKEELKTAAGGDAFLGNVSVMAHKLGLNNTQYEQMVQWGVEQSVAMNKQQKEATEMLKADLRKEWGFAYDDKVGLARRTLAGLTTGPKDPLITFLDATGLSDHPEIIKLFNKLGDIIGEDNILKEGQHTVDEITNAKDKILEIRGDPKHPFNDARHVGHRKAVQDMNALYEIANGA